MEEKSHGYTCKTHEGELQTAHHERVYHVARGYIKVVIKGEFLGVETCV